MRKVPAIAAACLEAYKGSKLSSKKKLASKSLKSKQDAEDYWSFNSFVRRREESKKEEAEERNRADPKRRRTATGQNKALAAFMRTTGGANSFQREQDTFVDCPFCSRR